MVQAYPWLLAAHLIAIVLWVSAITTIYWMLRLHDHVSGDSRDKLTLMERSLALSADVALTVALGCGVALAIAGPGGGTSDRTWFSPGFGPWSPAWLHIKIAVVVLAMLSVHGILRGRIKRFARGQIKPVPTWLWSLFLAGLTVAVIAAATKFGDVGKSSTPPEPPTHPVG